jgi:hypothetical protein
MSKGDPISGQTIRWSYEDGPTKGTEFEHVFGTDGRVSYRMLSQPKPQSQNAGARSDGGSKSGGAKQEKPSYEVAEAAPGVWAVAYLAPSGYTLTTVLDMASGRIVSFASNEKELVVQHGTFEVMTSAKR